MGWAIKLHALLLLSLFVNTVRLLQREEPLFSEPGASEGHFPLASCACHWGGLPGDIYSSLSKSIKLRNSQREQHPWLSLSVFQQIRSSRSDREQNNISLLSFNLFNPVFGTQNHITVADHAHQDEAGPPQHHHTLSPAARDRRRSDCTSLEMYGVSLQGGLLLLLINICLVYLRKESANG